ncbi:MAG: DUF4369 domain-containing protein [Candidatus Bacteroides intestinipullorum]|uniref:DUF4369 domain-containing protein n=1 Tax=Candidatus Bacteroides intestinipullorum TaxID=2838471 RepID=A0A9E2KGL9_9BACE|nr:DUF4369 domain-containing protein [Candidatus Bacteroides intestinipullorum]
MVKHLTYLFIVLSILLVACKPTSGEECRIVGQLPDHSRDGKWVYLVPFIRPDSMGVDSVKITDGKFVFTTRKHLMGIIRVELKSRWGIQDLLVVTEPGEVAVKLDSISSAGGTPQNDLLQQWKEYTQAYGRQIWICQKTSRTAHQAGDTVTVSAQKVVMDSLRREYRHYSWRLMELAASGPLYDFLKQRFPESYQRKMPDGTVKEIKLD